MINSKNAAPGIATQDSISSRNGNYHPPKTFGDKVISVMKGAVVASILSIVIFAGVECLFSIAHVGEDTIVQPDPLMGYTHLGNHSVTYRLEGYARSTTNSMGYRDKEFVVPKPPGLTRIAVMGDSVTMGLEVPMDRTFPKVLERRLQADGHKNVEVLNCGMSGYGTGQEYLSYKQKVSTLHPDMLIVAFHLGDSDDDMAAGTNPPRATFSLSPAGKLQVDFKSVDSWFSKYESRFYSSFEQLRRKCHILAVLTRANLVMGPHPAYVALSKVFGEPLSNLWSRFLSTLPPGDWKIEQARASVNKSELAPNEKPIVTVNHVGVATTTKTNLVVAPVVATPVAVAPAAVAPVVVAPVAVAPAAVAPATVAPAGKAGAVPVPLALLNGQETYNLFRGYLSANTSRIEVTKAILSALNEDCKKQHCKLVVAGLPVYNNSIFYVRQLNALRNFAKKEGFQFVDSWTSFPARDPLQEDDNFYSVHFNYKGHRVMSDTLYNAIFKSKKWTDIFRFDDTVQAK